MAGCPIPGRTRVCGLRRLLFQRHRRTAIYGTVPIEQVPSPWWASSARQTTRRRCRQRRVLRYRTLPPGRHRTAQVVQTQMRLPALSARADVAAAEPRHGSTRPLRPQYGLLDARRRFRHVCEIVLYLDDRSAVEAGWVQRRAGLVTHSSSDNCYDLACRAPALHHAPVAGCPARVVADLPVCASSGACLPALCPASHVASPRRPEAPDDCCDIVDASFRMSADAPNTSGRTPCTGLAPRVSPTTCRACLPCMRPRRGRHRPAPPANAAAYDHNRALLAACSPPGQRRVVALIALATDARIRLPAPVCVHVDVAADHIWTGQLIHDEDNAPATPPPP